MTFHGGREAAELVLFLFPKRVHDYIYLYNMHWSVFGVLPLY